MHLASVFSNSSLNQKFRDGSIHKIEKIIVTFTGERVYR